MAKLLSALVTAGLASVCWASPAPPTPTPTPITPVMQGRDLAQRNCQVCHAIAATDTSALPEAKPLRDLNQLYPIDSLTEAFGEGILVGHSSMPEFEFEPHQIDSLLAYIKSIQTKPEPRERAARKL